MSLSKYQPTNSTAILADDTALLLLSSSAFPHFEKEPPAPVVVLHNNIIFIYGNNKKNWQLIPLESNDTDLCKYYLQFPPLDSYSQLPVTQVPKEISDLFQKLNLHINFKKPQCEIDHNLALVCGVERTLTEKDGIQVSILDLAPYRNNPQFVESLYTVLQQSYQDPRELLDYNLKKQHKLYLAKEKDKIVGFFMAEWQRLNISNKNIPALYLGCAVTCEEKKGQGITQLLLDTLISDVQAWERTHSQRLLLWHTTASPLVVHLFSKKFDCEPTNDGSYTQNGVTIVNSIKNNMDWDKFDHPFVIRNREVKVFFKEQEKQRIKTSSAKRSDIDLLADLKIDETKRDRLIRIFYVPHN